MFPALRTPTQQLTYDFRAPRQRGLRNVYETLELQTTRVRGQDAASCAYSLLSGVADLPAVLPTLHPVHQELDDVAKVDVFVDLGQKPQAGCCDGHHFRLVNEVIVEAALQQDSGITAIAMVCHETSTSIVNPVAAVGRLAEKYGKTYFVDAVSAVGGEDLDVVRDHIDFCTCSSNKCLASLAGVGIICARRSLLEALPKGKPRNAYLNLRSLYRFSEESHQTPNTPSVTMFIALEAAVKRLIREGLDNQIARHRRCAKVIREGVRKMGLETLVDDSVASNTVTSVFLPDNMNLNAFIQALEDRSFTVYPGKGPLLEKNMFQIANMGQINEADCRLFCDVMVQTLERF